MPAWWNRKWSKSKEEQEQPEEEDEEEEPRAAFQLNFMSGERDKNKGRSCSKKKTKSFDDKVKGVPLPLPSHSLSDPIQSFGSVSVSGGSSISSSTSYDDHPISPPNTNRFYPIIHRINCTRSFLFLSLSTPFFLFLFL